jgi:hypothetical protein
MAVLVLSAPSSERSPSSLSELEPSHLQVTAVGESDGAWGGSSVEVFSRQTPALAEAESLCGDVGQRE